MHNSAVKEAPAVLPSEARLLLAEERISAAEGRAQHLCARLDRTEMVLREAVRLLGQALQQAAKKD